MATNIKPTPKLNKRQSEQFLKTIAADLGKPCPVVIDNDRLEKVHGKVAALASKHPKRSE